MKRINLFWIIWIFVILEFKAVICVSYPGVYRNERPVIIPGASPIENVFVTERYGLNYECIETCYPIFNICGELCNVRPDLPECSQCQRLPAVQPTPIIIETPPYEPISPAFETHNPRKPVIAPSRLPRPPIIPKPIRPTVPRLPNFRPPPRPIISEIPRPPQLEVFERVLPTPVLPDIPRPPVFEFFEPELPPILPDVPEPPVFELMQPELPQPPELELFEPETPPQPPLPDVPHPPQFEYFEPELPPIPVLPNVPLPPRVDVDSPPQLYLPEVPQFEDVMPPQPYIPEIPRPPQFEFESPPQPYFPEVPQFEVESPPQPYFPDVPQPPQFEIELPPQSILPNVPLPPQFEVFEIPQVPRIEVFEPDLPSPPIFDAPSIIVYDSPQIPQIELMLPEIMNQNFEQIPDLPLPHPNFIIPERPAYFEPIYPENLLLPESMINIPEVSLIAYEEDKAGLLVDRDGLQPPMANNYRDICNDYCLLKRNISECEMCLQTGVPADYLELCSNCLVSPSEPACQLCYPILLNLCREFCIFEENEPDCSICYPQPIVELPETLNDQSVLIPAPIFPTTMEYVPIEPEQICPEYCVLTPTSAECAGCVVGVEVMEKICVDICAGYCLENPNDEQCAVCYTTTNVDSTENNEEIVEELPTLEVINYQCCYGEYCTPMPRNGICPVVCKELCTTACSNECFNPKCPDCQEVVALNEHRRTQFMIWLKSKLSDMKSRYMAMIEACIRRTELLYERELQAIETEVDTSFLLE